MNENKKEVFLKDLNQFVAKRRDLESTIDNSINCFNMFDSQGMYLEEGELLALILASRSKTTVEQGDLLEKLMKSLFGRIKLIDSIDVTNRDTAIGQIDLQLHPIDEQAYNVLGLVSDKPLGLMGECKNYGSSSKVEKEEIEKMCWRCCKAGFLSFFVGRQFTSGALNEVDVFNLYKSDICKKHCGVFIVPISLEMIKIIVDEKINFCYFVNWAIGRSKNHGITSYLRGS